jgi:hypothetical protein
MKFFNNNKNKLCISFYFNSKLSLHYLRFKMSENLFSKTNNLFKKIMGTRTKHSIKQQEIKDSCLVCKSKINCACSWCRTVIDLSEGKNDTNQMFSRSQGNEQSELQSTAIPKKAAQIDAMEKKSKRCKEKEIQFVGCIECNESLCLGYSHLCQACLSVFCDDCLGLGIKFLK